MVVYMFRPFRPLVLTLSLCGVAIAHALAAAGISVTLPVRDLVAGRQVASDIATQHGVAAERLTATGYGKSKPVADNGGDEGRAKNRRVEIADPRCTPKGN